MHILVKDLAVCERPYEKAERYGVSALSDAVESAYKLAASI